MQPYLLFIVTPELVYRRYQGAELSQEFAGEGPVHTFEKLANGDIDREAF